MTTNSPVPIGLIPQMSTQQLNEIVSRMDLDKTTFNFVMDELDNRKYDVLSAITPEEMVQLENLPNGEPFEDIDGYCVRLNQQVRDIQNGGR